MSAHYGDWYLDLNAISSLSKDEKDNINSYYIQMLESHNDSRFHVASSLFHTLQKAGYIKNATTENRDEKLGELING